MNCSSMALKLLTAKYKFMKLKFTMFTFQFLKVKKTNLLGMKLTFALLLCMLAQSFAGLYSQSKINLECENKSIFEVFKDIELKTGFTVFYSSLDLNPNTKISFSIKDANIEEVLKTVLEGTDLTYTIINDMIAILKEEEKPEIIKTEIEAIEIKGKVTDSEGIPLPGATILEEGTMNGVITSSDGTYKLTVASPQSKLKVSYIGFTTQTIEVGNKTTINIILKESSEILEEVVVTGYFERKKENYTGAVTTVKGSELKKISTENILSSLSILDPSFTLVDNNILGSNPNAIPDFQIRGGGSIKSEFEGNPNMPTFMLDGFEVSATKVFDMDPNRIESITVLKDAVATAIYGSRSANGVVVIKTKTPKMGKLRVSYNSSYNFDIPDLSVYNLMNASEKLEYEKLSGLYPTDSRIDWVESNLQEYNEKLKLIAKGYDTDWMSIPVKDVAIGQKHAIGIEGGDEAFRYGVDVSYFDKVGVMKGSGRKNIDLGIRLQYNYKNIRFINYTSYANVKSQVSPYGDFSQYSYLNPYYYPYDENGNIVKLLNSYTYYDRGFLTKRVYNGLYNTTLPVRDESQYNEFLNNFSIEYNILEGLRLRSNISISKKTQTTDRYLPYEHIDFIDKEDKGSYYQSFTNSFSYDANVVLSFVKTMGKHFINATSIYNIRENTDDNTSLTAVGFPNETMDHIGMGIKFLEGTKPSGYYNRTRLIGLVGNFNYSYDNRYLLDIAVRTDGSSIFGANKRWGTFYSVGLGWNIHKELFLKDNDLVSMLKLKASIGTTGGQNFYPYQALAMYSYTDGSISGISYSNYIGALLKALGNTDLKWQKTEKKNIGIDFEILNRRISGNFNVYSDVSKDVLIDATLPPSLGFSSYKDNLGIVKNSGVELSLRAKAIKNKEFEWDLYFNVIKNKNQLVEINDALTAFNNSQDIAVRNKPVVRYMEGESLNTIWANESLGIDPTTGDEVFIDIDGNLTDKWSTKNYKPLGNTDPDFYGNFGTKITYRGLEFIAFFMYSYGGEIYNTTLVDKIENVNPNENGDKRILYDRWKKPGDIAKYKRVSDVSTTYPTSRFIESNNYIQLQSLSLAYTFNPEKLKKLGIERLRISAITNNLFRLSTVKMERGTSYPFARTFSLSLQLTF